MVIAPGFALQLFVILSFITNITHFSVFYDKKKTIKKNPGWEPGRYRGAKIGPPAPARLAAWALPLRRPGHSE